MIVLALAGRSFAQDAPTDGLDAHGFHLVPGDGEALDFLSVWRPEERPAGGYGVDALLEYADQPLVRFTQDDDQLGRTVLVDDVLALNLAGSYSLHDNFAVAASLPLYFTALGPDGTSKPAIGDVRLSLPVGLVDESGVGYSAVPYFDLPTGANKRLLGSQGLAAGTDVAVGFFTERVALSLTGGFEADPSIDYANLHGGFRLKTGAGVGFELVDWLAVRAEAHTSSNLVHNDVGGSDFPAEALLSAKARYANGVTWTAGGAAGLSHGAGAATYRIFAGVGFTHDKPPPPPDTDGDGFIDTADNCPTSPETVNGYSDLDGCDDDLAGLTVTVVNEDGEPVTDAVVTIDGAATTHLMDVMPGPSVAVHVEHPWYEVTDATVPKLVEGDNALTVTLHWLPGKVRVITKSSEGAIIDARVRFDGPLALEPQPVGDDGTEVFSLRPGDWRILVSAESFGTERRDLVIEPGQTSLVVIEVVMYPTKTVVQASEIKILDQVNFDFDKDTIKPESFALLDQVANVFLDHPDILRVEVQGHTDDKGDDAYNLELSQRRVESVRRYLVGKGVAEDRLVAVGYGETKPIASNATDAGRAANRRVQFVIVDPPAVAP